jgi:hypothetical protein
MGTRSGMHSYRSGSQALRISLIIYPPGSSLILGAKAIRIGAFEPEEMRRTHLNDRIRKRASFSHDPS